MRLRRARPLLGTVVEITAYGADAAWLEAAVARAFRAVSKVQELMSFHSAQSDVSRLNRAAATRSLNVAPETWQVLAAAQRISAASDGAFDVTVAPRLVARGHLPVPAAPPPSLRASWRDIELDAGGRVRFHAPLWIDLGGIAKGYAVDQAVGALRRAGVFSGLVNAGGDMRAFGDGLERVGVRDPADPGRLLDLGGLRNAALASSARTPGDNWSTGPHVDPRADVHGACPATTCAGTSVVARDCMIADALTKVVMARGLEAAAVLDAMHAAALIIDGRGQAMATRQPLLADWPPIPRCRQTRLTLPATVAA
jgi:FAD:protein FMN transferase